MTTAKINTSLDKLLHDLDNLQIKRRPLQPHVIQILSQPDKVLYATVLVTLLTNQDISEAQSRLLAMLLDSMAMTNNLQKIYANIPKLDIEQLKIFCELCDKHSLGASFLMDVLTLCRLDKALNEQQSKSLSELVSLLGLDETALLTILHLSNKVLGDTITPGAELSEAKIKELSRLGIYFDYESLKPWHEFSYQVMTIATLKQGMCAGDWIVLEEHNIEEGIIIKNANIVFTKNASININGNSGSSVLSIKYSSLINANIKSINLDIISIENSLILDSELIFKGINKIKLYDSSLFSFKNIMSHYAINVEDIVDIHIDTCNFYLRNSNGLIFRSPYAKININNSDFIMSSSNNEDKKYNALFFSDTTSYSINNCQFTTEDSHQYFIKDSSNRGCKNILESNFTCKDDRVFVQDKQIENNLYICSDQDSRDFIIFRNCKFENVLSYFNISNTRTLFYNSSFVNSIVCNNITDNESNLFSNCNIKNKDKPIIKKIEYVD